MPTAAASRLSALAAHVDRSSTPAMATDTKPPITCHVLDTAAGRPAPSIPVQLTLHPARGTAQAPQTFTSTTDADGRVAAWTPAPAAPALEQALLAAPADADQHCTLRFDTEAYFAARGVAPFFPDVEVRFVLRPAQRAAREHFHVPVLVTGFGYTTYRGS